LCSSNGEMLLVIGARQLLHYPLQIGNLISSVGWNMELSTDNETGFIVLGTTRGYNLLSVIEVFSFTLVAFASECQ
uniref:MMS1_N domain-containing protein n=1 Tax=Gongylonema pulchrum TaxID=637853 RepID=A0A183EJI9_9BILA